VLTTDHEYGGCVLAWQAAARARGAELVIAPLPDPLTGPAGVLASLDAARTDRARVVFVSHLASATSVLLPVVEICGWAREHGLLSVIDGAHVPGQLPLDVVLVGADVHVGSCHKWLCGPKAAAFLWVAPPLRDMVQPLVVSWGCEPGSSFARRQSWGRHPRPGRGPGRAGRDRLPGPARLAGGARPGDRPRDPLPGRVRHPVRSSTAASGGPDWHRQMVAVPLPVGPGRSAEIESALLDRWRIEVHVRPWRSHTLIRPSFQGYNDQADLDRLLEALNTLV